MKAFLFSFLAIALVGQSSIAAPSTDVRLGLSTQPIHQRPGSISTRIQLLADGKVFGTTYRFGSLIAIVPRLVTTLSADRMSKVEKLIKDAYEGTIVPPNPHGVHCMAVPINHVKFTADNDKLLLESGDVPCGLMTHNDAPAAQALINLLGDFNRQYNQMVSGH